MGRKTEHPLIEKQKTRFRLGQKSFKCNQCGQTHNSTSDNAIDKCIDAAMKNTPPADLKNLRFHQWFWEAPDLFEKVLRAAMFEKAMHHLGRLITMIISIYSRPTTTWYPRHIRDSLDGASLLSLHKEELNEVLVSMNNYDAEKQMNGLFSKFPPSEIKEWVNHVLSGKLYEDNPFEHDWNPVIDHERKFRNFRSFKGNETSYVLEVEELLGDYNGVDARITPDGLEFRNTITHVHLSIPFDVSQPVRKTLKRDF